MVLISKDKLRDIKAESYRDGREEGRKDSDAKYKEKIQSLEVKAIETKSELEKSNAELKVLRADRDKVREVLKKEMENKDLEIQLVNMKSLQDKREERLNKRSNELDSEEEANYKKGYADGVADGLREVHKITQGDRDNLAKIAMVAAASHTSIETIKEVNSEFRLTEGSTSAKKAK